LFRGKHFGAKITRGVTNSTFGNFNMLRLGFDDSADCFFISDDQLIPDKSMITADQTVKAEIPIYGKEKRYITPRDCARLQSFPEDCKLAVDDKKSYKQLGNSVNVENVFNVISSTLKHYSMI
jgi:site-specific DNA-cytosine methylase